MLSEIALLFILLHQLSEYQAFCLGLWSLRKCYWQCNRYYPPVCSDYIADHIALIILLWLYSWLHCFNCFDCIAGCITLTVLLIILLWLYCAWKCFLLLVSFSLSNFKIRAVQDVIYFTHKSHTCIQSFIKTHPQNPLSCLKLRLDILSCYRLKLMLTFQESGLPCLASRSLTVYLQHLLMSFWWSLSSLVSLHHHRSRKALICK